MPERIPQSVARRVSLKVFLSSDHISPATGKTVAVVISKNGGAFGNPSAGATNATEISNGWYYVDLSTTDTGTAGPLIVRGTATSCDDSEQLFFVADPHNAGFDGVPSATAGASGGLQTGAPVKKNAALAAFEFVMTDSTTHAPKTGVTVTATRSLDGAAFGACANAVVEVANGVYKIDLAAADLNANVVTLRFTGASSDDLFVTLVTQP